MNTANDLFEAEVENSKGLATIVKIEQLWRIIAGRIAATAGRRIDELETELSESFTWVEEGCKCDCAGRDPWEIACYLSPDELEAVITALYATTFGQCEENDIETHFLNKATKELKATQTRRTSDA